MATPAAVMPSRAALMVGSVWNWMMEACRSLGFVRPSMRMIFTPANTVFSRSSSTLWWCAKTKNLGAVGELRIPSMCLRIPGSFAVPVFLKSCIKRLFRWSASSLLLRVGSWPRPAAADSAVAFSAPLALRRSRAISMRRLFFLARLAACPERVRKSHRSSYSCALSGPSSRSTTTRRLDLGGRDLRMSALSLRIMQFSRRRRCSS
mmetsp:Transcript_27895/g.62260  ORF Transcript_27895/g.62260 Transcript_27895/m.62260 type:complete len:206 (+) Transcript_27895:1443-2060(+)